MAKRADIAQISTRLDDILNGLVKLFQRVASVAATVHQELRLQAWLDDRRDSQRYPADLTLLTYLAIAHA